MKSDLGPPQTTIALTAANNNVHSGWLIGNKEDDNQELLQIIEQETNLGATPWTIQS